LSGGYVIIYTVPGEASEGCQFRGVVGNDYSAANAAITVYLDGPLNTAVETTSTCEIFQNPYAALRTGTVANYPKAGLPAV